MMFKIGQKVRLKDLRYNFMIRDLSHDYPGVSIYVNYTPLKIAHIVDHYYLVFEESNNIYDKRWMFNFVPICALPKNIKVL
jgi:hypothetical protein